MLDCESSASDDGLAAKYPQVNGNPFQEFGFVYLSISNQRKTSTLYSCRIVQRRVGPIVAESGLGVHPLIACGLVSPRATTGRVARPSRQARQGGRVAQRQEAAPCGFQCNSTSVVLAAC